MSERGGGHPGQWPVKHRLNSFNESGQCYLEPSFNTSQSRRLHDIASELPNVALPYIKMSQSLLLDVDVRPNLDVWASCNIMLSRVFLVMISLSRQVAVRCRKDDDVAGDYPVEEEDEGDSWWMDADVVDDDGQQH